MKFSTYSPKRFWIIFLLLALLPSWATAQNSIDNVLNNTVTSCSMVIGEIITVKTIQELKNAINTANTKGGNMTILIADGTYQIASTSWYPYITASNVVFRSASGNRDSVSITGGGMRNAGGVENGFYFVGNNITVADLTIKNVGNHAISTHGDSLLVYNVRFQNTYEQMLKGTSAEDGADFGVVRCCLFEYTAGVGPQFYIGGIDVHKGDGWLVQDNVFRNIKSPSGSVAEHAIHFWNNSAANTVERNLIVNCDRGIGFGLGSSAHNGGIIRNNMIYNDGTGKYSDVGIALETSPNTRVYNNTIYLATYPNAIEYRFAATTNVDIKNNLCNKAIKLRDSASGTLGNNVTNAQPGWFVEPTAGNLRLKTAIASVVDKGTPLAGYVTDDVDKNTRTVGQGIDIGAWEYIQQTRSKEHGKGMNDYQLSLYPNPFSSIATIRLQIPTKQNISIRIRSLSGIEVSTLQKKELYAGIHFIPFDGNDLPSGIYFIEMIAGNTRLTKKSMLIKPTF